MKSLFVGNVCEWTFTASVSYRDPYNDVDFAAYVITPTGARMHVPGFWNGGSRFAIRFSPAEAGRYHLETTCSSSSDSGLHGRKREFNAESVRNPRDRGLERLTISNDGRSLAYVDGAPFFWLGDTWWMGLSRRMDWPRGFSEISLDRAEKGFSVIQIIAGPYPDMTAFDPRGEGEGGFPLERDFKRVRPEYFSFADRKIAHLVKSGLHPCIVGMWGYYLIEMGTDVVKRYWRYLIARYGAYPVLWCAAGEAAMPFYLSGTKEADVVRQRDGWTDVIREIKSCDPYRNPITIHPTDSGRNQVTDPKTLDFDMLQTGHSGYASLPNTFESVQKSRRGKPTMPVVVSETNYEGIMGSSHQDVQRRQFFGAILSGASGFTYGGNGIWQAGTVEAPYGPSPHGRGWGDVPWRDAMKLPGAAQIAAGADFLRALPWQRLEPATDRVENPWSKRNHGGNFAAATPDGVCCVYVPQLWNPPRLVGFKPGKRLKMRYWNPIDCNEIDLGKTGTVKADSDGGATPPLPPFAHDWLLVIEP